MRRSSVMLTAAVGLALGAAGALGLARPTAAQNTERFTLFEMFGRDT
ncbi:MAG: hypothetical protein ABI780_13955 [Ardenticatenales bacterium]